MTDPHAADPVPDDARLGASAPPRRRRPPAAVIAAVAVLLVAAGAAAFVLTRGSDEVGTAPPQGPEGKGSIAFPLGTRITAADAEDGRLWLASTGGRWTGLTRVDGAGARFFAVRQRGAFPVVATGDGGAWAVDGRRLTRIAPDGAVRRVTLPDGAIDPAGFFPVTAAGDSHLFAVGTEGRITEVTTAGKVRLHDLALDLGKDCTPGQLAPAAGGGFWLAPFGCPASYVVRIAPDLRSADRVALEFPSSMRASYVFNLARGEGDRMYFLTGSIFAPTSGSFGPDGRVTAIDVDTDDNHPPEVLSSDGTGTAWSRLSGRCSLVRYRGRDATVFPAPVAPLFVFGEPDGRVQVVGERRVTALKPSASTDQAGCDAEPPELTASYGGRTADTSVAALREKGVRYELGEPAILDVGVAFDVGSDRIGEHSTTRVVKRAGAVTIKLPERLLKRVEARLAGGDEVKLIDNTGADDGSGNRDEAELPPIPVTG